MKNIKNLSDSILKNPSDLIIGHNFIPCQGAYVLVTWGNAINFLYVERIKDANIRRHKYTIH